ncbi:centromere protein X [Conger conger]|uniref:centromere protein X n=1 Tax=Conger conger TaxID=82655 RepID=UPI002A59A3E8|nr:centromere protein X [Conger conger]
MDDREPEIVFKKETVSKLLSLFFKDDKTRVSGDAALLMTEMLKVFVQEAARRAAKQANTEDNDTVDIDHFEKILPQLLLDF